MAELRPLAPLDLQGLLGVAPPQANAPLPQAGYLNNFLTSALRSGSSELVGLPGAWTGGVTGTSPQQNDDWRNENLVSSIASQIIGAVPAYVASMAVAPQLAGPSALGRVAPPLARLFSQEALIARPVATTAGRAIAEVAPLSLARLTATPLMDGDLERVATSVGLDLALGGVLGAGFGAIRAVRGGNYGEQAERVLADRVPEYNINTPAQERLDALLRSASNFATDPDMARIINANIEGRRLDVRLQNPTGKDFLGDLDGIAPERVKDDLNRLFKANSEPTGGIRVQTLSNTSTGFPTPNEWRGLVGEVGLLDNWETVVQFPRVVTAATQEQAARLNTNLSRHLIDVGNGWFIRRQANDDMFVVARRLWQGDRPEVGNRWFVARTNDPNKLIPQAPMFRRNERLSRFIGKMEEDQLRKTALAMPDDAAGTPVLKNNQQMVDALPPLQRRERAKWDLMEKIGITNPAKESAVAVDSIWQRAKNVAAPAMAQFSKAPLAAWTYIMAKSTFEMAQGRARRWLYGDVKVTGAPAGVLIRGSSAEGGLRGAFNELKPDDARVLRDFWGARLGGMSREEAMTALDGATPDARIRVGKFLDELFKVQDGVIGEVSATEKLVGATKLTPLEDSYDFPHVWVGQWRQRAFDERGRLRYVGDGATRDAAYRDAERWAKLNNGKLDARGPFMADSEADQEVALELFRAQRKYRESFKETQPTNLDRRQNTTVGGYLADPNKPVPKLDEIWKVLEQDINTKMQNVASLVVERQLKAGGLEKEILSRYGDNISNALNRRVNDMVGRQTEISRWQNKALAPLDPLLGKNSATKIATTWNAIETHLNLFVGNVAYVAANALTFFQTVAPKLALTRQMIARGEGTRALELFDYNILATNEGMRGAAATMNPWKLAMGALKDLRNPSEASRQHFARAVREGAVAPKMFDEYLGENARVWTSMKKVWQGDEPLSNTMRAAAGLNSLVPVKTEELTRAHTFFIGLRMGETLGLQGEAAYQLAKQFTLRTMYGYAQSDRPRMFTGPAGLVFGLFKNWMFHYLADFGLYTREAMRGNYNGLLWATAGTAAIGGLGGIPLYALVDSFQKMYTKQPIMEELYGAVGTDAGDALYFGLPGLLGVSLQASASAPFNDPIRDITFMFNVAALDRVGKISRLGGEVWNQWARGGVNPFETDRTWDMMAYALGPRTLYKAMAQVEDGALRSIRNGRPIIDGITENEYALNMVGLTPTKIARAWEASESLWGDQQSRRARTAGFSDAYFEAWSRGDQRSMQDAVARAVEQGVDISSMMRGAMLRMRNSQMPQMPYDYLRMPEGRGVDRLRTLGLME